MIDKDQIREAHLPAINDAIDLICLANGIDEVAAFETIKKLVHLKLELSGEIM